MNVFEDVLKEISDQMGNLLEEDTVFRDITNYFENIDIQINNFEKNGSFVINEGNNGNIKKERITEVIADNESSKEILETPRESTNKPVQCATRLAAHENTKTPINIVNSHELKLERISEVSISNNEAAEMLPSQNRTTNVPKVKAKHISPKQGRESDVYIQPEHVSIINLSDNGDDIKEKPLRSTRTKTPAQINENELSVKSSFAKEPTTKTKKDMLENDVINFDNTYSTRKVPVRPPRTKTRALAAKQSEMVQDNEKQLQKSDIIGKPSESDKIQKKIQKEKGEKETAKRSHSISPIFNESKHQKYKKLNKPADNKPADSDNCSDKTLIVNEKVNLSDLLTDHDDKTYNQITVKKPGKPIFSTFENSPVKKRVEAFEKLGAQFTSNTPCNQIDKNKSKLLKKQEEKNKDGSVKSAVKSKIKVFTNTTPLKSATKLTPSKSQTPTKRMKLGLKDLIHPKSATALKAYQQEFFERELRRQEKEREVARKREAVLQAKKDENKRKHEEKQPKAQQGREALLKSKQQMVEETKKLENKKCDQIFSKKFTKLFEKQETNALIGNISSVEIKATPLKKNFQKPIFLDMSAPLLPLADCYDSDDERKQYHDVRPKWTKKNKMYQVLRTINFVGYECVNTLFMCQATTLDLQALFGTLNAKKLKRTSSAVWNKQPRFTIMPITNEEDEENSQFI